MDPIKSTIKLVSEWLTSECSTHKLIKLIETPGTTPHQIHLCYHKMPHDEKEDLHVQSFLKSAIIRDDPAVLQAVINLVGGGDVNQHVTVHAGNVIGYCHAMAFDLLSYAFYEGAHQSAMFLATHPRIKLSEDQLRSASYKKNPDLQNVILDKMGFGDFSPR